MTSDRPNLAGAFNTKTPIDRSAGLAGLLPPVRRNTPAPAPAPLQQPADTTAEQPSLNPADSAPHVDQTPARSAQSRPVRPIRGEKTAPVSASADIPANVAVYLEADLLETARQQRRTLGITYDELVVQAFAAITDEQLRHAFTPAAQPHTTPAMPTRQRRLRGTAGIQVQIRLNGPQRTWLEEKQTATGAPSRSALVATALRLHLKP